MATQLLLTVSKHHKLCYNTRKDTCPEHITEEQSTNKNNISMAIHFTPHPQLPFEVVTKRKDELVYFRSEIAVSWYQWY